MRLLTSAAALFCAGAAVLSGVSAGAPEKARLIVNPPAQVGARWVGVVASPERPVVRARLGSRSQAVTVRRLRRGRWQLRTTFRSAGRWSLWVGKQRLGIVVVRAAPLRLTNAADVAVEPSGSLLVADLSNRIFRQNGERLSLVAGNGRGGRSGDGGPALRAALGFPVEVAVDPRGGFGIVHDERWIRHVDTAGTIRTVAEFAQPTALAYDGAGNLWVSELGGRVQRRDAATGTLTTYGGFNQPHGLDVAPDGTVYVCDTFNNRVQRISPSGVVTTLAAGLNVPVDLDVGPDGNVYVADFGGSRVFRITPAGSMTEIGSGLRGTNSVAVGADGAIYVTERGRATVRRLAVAGLAAFKPARAGTPWTGTMTAKRRPSVTARNGVTTQPVAVRRTGRNRYRLRAVFPFSGRWQLVSGRHRLGAVTVRPAPPLASALPTAQAFRLCGGTGAPYPQYALSWDPAGGLWASCGRQAQLRGISLATGETRAILRLTSTPFSIAAGLGAVWSAGRGPVVERIDLRTGRAASAISGGGFSYVFTGAGSVWGADDENSALIRYDPAGRRVLATIPTGSGTSALVAEAGSVWIVNHRDGTLQRIDPATNASTPLGRLPGDAPERMTYAEGSLWVTGRGTDLLRVDPTTGAVQRTIEIGAGAIDVRAAAHSIWVAVATHEADRQGNPFLDRLLRIDPVTNAITETLRPTGRVVVNGAVSTGNSLWIADTAAGRLYRITR
jgi:sugar lactone lactonase YvrE